MRKRVPMRVFAIYKHFAALRLFPDRLRKRGVNERNVHRLHVNDTTLGRHQIGLAYSRFSIYYSRIAMTIPFFEQNDQTKARAQHLEALRALVGNVYPNKFKRSNVTDTVSGEDTLTSIVDTFK